MLGGVAASFHFTYMSSQAEQELETALQGHIASTGTEAGLLTDADLRAVTAAMGLPLSRAILGKLRRLKVGCCCPLLPIANHNGPARLPGGHRSPWQQMVILLPLLTMPLLRTLPPYPMLQDNLALGGDKVTGDFSADEDAKLWTWMEAREESGKPDFRGAALHLGTRTVTQVANHVQDLARRHPDRVPAWMRASYEQQRQDVGQRQAQNAVSQKAWRMKKKAAGPGFDAAEAARKREYRARLKAAAGGEWFAGQGGASNTPRMGG